MQRSHSIGLHSTGSRPAAGDANRLSLAGGALVAAAMAFNAVLALVNGNIRPVSTFEVVAAEIAIVAGATAIVIAGQRKEMWPWLWLMAGLVLFAAVRGLATGDPDAKLLRDALVVPVFVMLGMASAAAKHGGGLERTIVLVHVLVFAVFLLEVLMPDYYAAWFDIQHYYMATRGFREDEFYNANSSLWISATRPGDRFFAFVSGPRTSSIFLEPVSLGNYCAIAAGAACALWRSLGTWRALAIIASAIVMVIGTDGRLAFVVVCGILALSPISGRWHASGASLLPPAVLAGAIVGTMLAAWQPLADNFTGRVAHSVYLLASFDVRDWLGLTNEHLHAAVDSGIAYLILSQSILGVVALWGLATALGRPDGVPRRRFTYALAVYVSFGLLVSYSVFTIKTAALLWFIHGALEVRGVHESGEVQT